MQEFEPKAVLTDNIWGYLWGKLIYGTLLFATALTDDSIADVLANRRYRPVLSALGLEVGAVAKANGVKAEAFDGFDPSAFAPGVAGRGDRPILRRHGRAQPAFDEVAFGDLARSRHPQAQDRGGRADPADRRVSAASLAWRRR